MKADFEILVIEIQELHKVHKEEKMSSPVIYHPFSHYSGRGIISEKMTEYADRQKINKIFWGR